MGLIVVCALYLGPTKLVILQHRQEASGVLTESYVEEYRNGYIYKPNHILHLKVNDLWVQLPQRYSQRDIREWDSFFTYLEGENVAIEYIDNLDVEPVLIRLSCDGHEHLSSGYFEAAWKREAIQNSLHGVLMLLACAIVYLFRSGFIRIRRV